MQGGGKGGSAVFGTPFEAGSGKKTLSVSLVKVSICTLGQVSPACDTCRLLLQCGFLCAAFSHWLRGDARLSALSTLRCLRPPFSHSGCDPIEGAL